MTNRLIGLFWRGLKLSPELGARALHTAMDNKSMRLFEAVLKAGVDMDAQEKEGVSLLRTAAAKGNEEMVRRSLAAGASVHKGKPPAQLIVNRIYGDNYAERDKLTAVAVNSGNANILSMLLKAGANRIRLTTAVTENRPYFRLPEKIGWIWCKCFLKTVPT